MKETDHAMREIDWKLLSELMKNSRRSDRELARAIGSSQPTVSRRRKKLENEGHIREYTMIPVFHKLGYEIMALTFTKLRRDLTLQQIEKAREATGEELKKDFNRIVMVENGRGLGSTGVIVSFHEGYASYTKFLGQIRQYPQFLELRDTRSFLIDLQGEVHHRPLSLSFLARHLLQLKEKDQ